MIQHDPARADDFVRRYLAGETLQQIGTRYGISRGRVRQIIAKRGVFGKDGGSCVRGKQKRQIESARRCEKCVIKHGLTLGQYALVPNEIRLAFRYQQRTAGYRGIAWRMNLREWMLVWELSGKWSERGVGGDKYCMARIDDRGPYAPDNVKIITNRENVREYAVAKFSGKRSNRARIARGVYYLLPGYSRPFAAQVGKRLTYHATAEEAISARNGYLATRANGKSSQQSLEAPRSTPSEGSLPSQ